MKKTTSKMSRFLVGAAIAGLMVGATTPLASCSGDGDASAKERNGCNGPNGCGGAGHEGKKEANGCNGPNGCGGDHAQKK